MKISVRIYQFESKACRFHGGIRKRACACESEVVNHLGPFNVSIRQISFGRRELDVESELADGSRRGRALWGKGGDLKCGYF